MCNLFSVILYYHWHRGICTVGAIDVQRFNASVCSYTINYGHACKAIMHGLLHSLNKGVKLHPKMPNFKRKVLIHLNLNSQPSTLGCNVYTPVLTVYMLKVNLLACNPNIHATVLIILIPYTLECSQVMLVCLTTL